MLDHTTWKEDPDLFSQITVDSEFMVKLGFFLQQIGEEIKTAYKRSNEEDKKVQIIVDYDPDKTRASVSFKFYHPTKKDEEQASAAIIKAFPPGAPINKILCSLSEELCDSLLAKIESHCNLIEINEMVRTLSRFEKTNTLPNAEKLNQIAIAFGSYAEEELKRRRSLSGNPTFEMMDSVRCLHRLSEILWNMIYRKTSHS